MDNTPDQVNILLLIIILIPIFVSIVLTIVVIYSSMGALLRDRNIRLPLPT